MNSLRLGCILEQQKPFMTRRPGRDAYDCPHIKIPPAFHERAARIATW